MGTRRGGGGVGGPRWLYHHAFTIPLFARVSFPFPHLSFPTISFSPSLQFTFIVTALMQSMGWAMSMLLLPIVPRKEAGLRDAVVAARRGSVSGVGAAAAGGGGGGARGERRAVSPGRR